MATLRLYPNGMTMHLNGTGSHERAKRGQVTGWSAASVRRHKRWLYGVVVPALDGSGFALTLTLNHTPADAAAWTALRAAWLERLRRLGASRVHWVVEWQERGAPHMHAAVYFPAGTPATLGARAVSAWVAVAEPYGSSWAGQDVKPIDGPAGWLQYLSKHAARGVRHYQRVGRPAGWTSTGRLWGYGGTWPHESEPIEVPALDLPSWWRFRRLVRSWLVADARAQLVAATDDRHRAAARRRLRWARRMLRSNDRGASAYRGMSEFLGQATALRLLEAL